MNVSEANVITAMAEGFWPTPAMTEPETVAWFACLGEPDMRPGDVQVILRRMARSGRAHRPRIGEVTAAVDGERRHRERLEGTLQLAEAPLTEDQRAAGLAALRRIRAELGAA